LVYSEHGLITNLFHRQHSFFNPTFSPLLPPTSSTLFAIISASSPLKLITDAEYSTSHSEEGFVHVLCFIPSSRSHTYFSPCLQQSAGSGGIVNTCQDSSSSDRPASSMGPDDFSPTCGREPIAVRSPWILVGSYFRLLNPAPFLIDPLHWSRQHRHPSLALTWP